MKTAISAKNKPKRDFIIALIIVSVCLAITIITNIMYILIKITVEEHNNDYAEGIVSSPAAVSPGYIWISLLVLFIWGAATLLCFFKKQRYFLLFTGYLFSVSALGYGWYTVTVLTGKASSSLTAFIIQMCCSVFAFITDPIWDTINADSIFVTVFSLIIQVLFAILNFYFAFILKKRKAAVKNN